MVVSWVFCVTKVCTATVYRVKGRRTIEGIDLIKVDLGVEEGLNRGGDVVGVVVLGVTVATVTMVMMVMPRHDGEEVEVEVP